MYVLPKLTYRANVIPIKISTEVFVHVTADSDIYIEKQEYPRHSSTEGGSWANWTLKLIMSHDN